MFSVVDVSHQYRGVHVVQQQHQQLASSNVVYVQVPASNAYRPSWNARHYLQTQSKCLGAVLVLVGSLSVVCNVVMAVSSSGWAAWYLTRAVLFAMMVSVRQPTLLLSLLNFIGFTYQRCISK